MAEELLKAVAGSSLPVFLAELGDKTMLATATVAALHNPLHVLAASSTAYLLANVVPVFLASGAASLLSGYTWALRTAAGALFVLLGVLTLSSRQGGGECGSLGAAFSAILLSEIGDKTQLTTLAVALASCNPTATLLGGVLGYLAANALGVFLSRSLSRRVSFDKLRKASGLLFILLGLAVVLSSLL
ncbi:TMEM165/GDT1 family protein [Infirmifilum sp. NZ]|uniref:TMEM165/GDT1 family protein n=1 Tax=Infirmifilum sp. NZ TaxID=2926850 RepID=UPI0027A6D719|nr:TMEM165/GDT1 family protein [Infirmifilum sp. NZ]UNQ73816.1 TMEM165/GDT1 family protein [Infirmifilum sp. NZ]